MGELSIGAKVAVSSGDPLRVQSSRFRCRKPSHPIQPISEHSPARQYSWKRLHPL